MKVTFLTAYFAPEITPVTHLFSDLARDLARRGAAVTVVANRPSRGLDEQTRLAYAEREDETADGVRILRVGAKRREGGRLALRAMHFLANTVSIYRTAKRLDTDVYLINSMPPYLGFIGALLKKKAPTVYILQDIFPDSMLAMGKMRAQSPLCRVFRLMERVTYRANTHFVTISSDMRDTLLQKGIPAARLSVIPNWIDSGAAEPISRAENPVFDRFELDRHAFTVCYAGTLGILQDVDTLLDAAALVQKQQPEIRFLIFGGGARYDAVRARILAEGLCHVTLLPLLPVDEANLAYSAGDVSLITLKKGVTKIATPSKTWSALAAERPVICTADAGSAWARTLLASGGAVIAEPENPASLAEAILSLYRMRDALPEMGRRGRDYVRTRLDRQDAANAYDAVLKQCLRGEKQSDV